MGGEALPVARRAATFLASPLGQAPLEPVVVESTIGGSSCVVVANGPNREGRGDQANWQGLQTQLYGRVGALWVPVRNQAAPQGNYTSSRQICTFSGAWFSQYRAELQLFRSGIEPTQWAVKIPELVINLVVGDGVGQGAVGASFPLQYQTGVMPAVPPNDAPQVSAAAERRRLIVEVVDDGGVDVGLGWAPLNLDPSNWYPLQLGRQYIFETTAPVWFQSDPIGDPNVKIVVVQELG